MKPTIVHIVSSSGMFGKEQVIMNLAKHHQDDFKVVVINISNNHDIAKKLENEAGVTIVAFTMKAGFNIKDARKLNKIVASYKPSLIHVHDYKSSIYMAPYLLLSKIPIIRTHHSSMATSMFTKLYLNELVDRMLLRFHDQIICVSKHQYPNLKRRTIISNGIPIGTQISGMLDEDILSFCDKKDENVTVLCAIGRLCPEKNHAMLISAVSDPRIRGKVKLLIFGSGPLHQELERFAYDLGIRQHVYFAGFHNNAAEYLSIMNLDGTTRIIDGLIQPSLIEGAPITILEALRAKTPIIASEVCDADDLLARSVINNANITSEQHLVGSIEAFCLNLANDQLGAQVKMGYNVFKEEFSSKGMSDKHTTLYNKLIARKHS